MTEYQMAQRKLIDAARERANAVALLQEADTNFLAAIRELEALEDQALPTASDVRGILAPEQRPA